MNTLKTILSLIALTAACSVFDIWRHSDERPVFTMVGQCHTAPTEGGLLLLGYVFPELTLIALFVGIVVPVFAVAVVVDRMFSKP